MDAGTEIEKELFIEPNTEIACIKENEDVSLEVKFRYRSGKLYKYLVTISNSSFPVFSLERLNYLNGKRIGTRKKMRGGENFYLELEGRYDKFVIKPLGKINDKWILGMKEFHWVDGRELTIPHGAAVGAEIIGEGRITTFNPSCMGNDKLLVREQYCIPCGPSVLGLYDISSRKRENSLIEPYDSLSISGVEDPRVVKIGTRWILTATKYNGYEVGEGIYEVRAGKWKELSTIRWDEKGTTPKSLYLLSYLENGVAKLYKDNYFYGLMGEGEKLFLVRTKDFKEWEIKDSIVEKGITKFSKTLVETGVWIKTKNGSFLLFNGRDVKGNYAVGYLELDDDLEISHVEENPFLFPQESWEKVGNAVNVTFLAGGFTIRKRKIEIYYGAADQRVGRMTISLKKDILSTLQIKTKEIREYFKPEYV